MIYKIAKYIKNIIFFLITIIINTFIIKRDQSTVLVGSWMGQKFADNSRFLFQFLSYNKNQLGLKKIIWATRNEGLYRELTDMKYDCCLMNTRESMYWHLKSGIHILCNATSSDGRFGADLDTKFSYGAKKIQLWHGVGVKAIGANSNFYRMDESKTFNRLYLKKEFGIEGGWGNAFFLCTSPHNMAINLSNENYIKKYMFISAYPRYCKCLQYLDEEKTVITRLSEKQFSILYLPTFRSVDTGYIHPLNNNNLRHLIKEDESLLWLEKQHSASKNSDGSFETLESVMVLDTNFDVNVLIDYVNVVITDYSSVAFDAFHKNIPAVLFTPDLETYQMKDKGLLVDYGNLFSDIIVKDAEALIDLIKQIQNGSYFTAERKELYNSIEKEFFMNQHKDYIEIWEDIKQL